MENENLLLVKDVGFYVSGKGFIWSLIDGIWEVWNG